MMDAACCEGSEQVGYGLCMGGLFCGCFLAAHGAAVEFWVFVNNSIHKQDGRMPRS